MSSKAIFFLFLVLVGIILFVILDLVGIHLPYMAKYAIATIAIVLYAVLAIIKARVSKQNHK